MLDKIFGKNLARDVDIFIPKGAPRPEIKDEKSLHFVELHKDFYFPPLLGCYNTDCYILTGNGVVAPVGFPEKPERLELLGGRGLTMIDVIHGIKTSLRYELSVSDEVKRAWQETLQREFDPEWMKGMFFESEKEVVSYIMDCVKEETGEEERQKVVSTLEEISGKKLCEK
ncbi:MAG: hypothetical protein ACOZBZ_04020 [Patescibacteria group bacterium]